MIDFKKVIAEAISKVTGIDYKELITYIEVPKEVNNGDYAFPCFRLAKSLKKAPQIIATEIKEQIQVDQNQIVKIDVIGGYLNFFVNKELLTSDNDIVVLAMYLASHFYKTDIDTFYNYYGVTFEKIMKLLNSNAIEEFRNGK